jgi:hypothetical protein
MAYIDLTVLNDLQALQATDELRVGKYGMINLVKDSTISVDYVPPSVKESLAKMSSERLAKIPVIKDGDVTVVTTPGFSFMPQNALESDVYSFSAFDVFTGGRIYPSTFEENQIDGQFYRDVQLKRVLEKSARVIEDIIETQLEARKTNILDYTTQVSQGDGTFSFDSTNDLLNISKAAQTDTMFTNLQTLMSANKLEGGYRLVTSPAGLQSAIVAAAKYGSGNSKNIAWDAGFLNLDRRYESHQISTSANFNGFFVRDGGIGLFGNYPYDFRNGTEIGGKKWSITDAELPFVNMRANVYINAEATDATALVAGTNQLMSHFEEYALWFRFYIVYRYNSDLATRANDIVKVVGLTT